MKRKQARPRRGAACASALRRALLLVDCVAELLQAGVKGAEESRHRVPADSAVAVLKLREVGRADVGAGAQLLLGQSCLVAQFAQCPPEEAVIFKGLICAGEVVLFTGAGFSVGACDCNGEPIPQVAQLTREIAQLVWPDEEPDDELTLPDTYAAALREKRKPLTDLIRTRLTVDPATVTPSQTTWFSMPWLRAYTLNIDDLESAAARATTLPRRIEPHSGLHGRLPLSGKDALLYVHLNGTLSDVPRCYVL
jgi:hypothetical protein